MGKVRNLFNKTKANISDLFPVLITSFASLSLSIFSFLPRIEDTSWEWISVKGLVLILSLAAAFFGAIWQANRVSGYTSLRDELEKTILEYNKVNESYERILNSELRLLSRLLHFTSTERITLYKHDGQALIRIGRYSSVLKLNRKGRSFISDEVGVVGRAWQSREGIAFVDNLPVIAGNDDYSYIRSCDLDWGMNRDDVSKLVMKSRTIGAFCLDDGDSARFAVVVFESLQEQAFSQDSISNILEAGEGERLSCLIQESVTPTPSQALEADY